MNTVEDYLSDPRMRAAVDELQHSIRGAFPGVTFEPYIGEDPDGLYIETVVDIDDTDEVIDLIIDRLVTFQVEDLLPLHIIPVQTPERQAALWEQQRTERLRRYM